MYYLDTSVLVPLFVKEKKSSLVRHFFEQHVQHTELVISIWTVTEFTSAIGMKVRLKEFSDEAGKKAIKIFKEAFQNNITVFPLEDADFNLAAEYLTEFSLGLRAGDALHLAIAQRQNAKKFFTFDQKLLELAPKFKLQIVSL